MRNLRALCLGFGVLGLLTGATRAADAATSCGTNCTLADSCEQGAVQAAVDAAVAAQGGTVRIPDPTGGTCAWSKPVKVDGTQVPLDIVGLSRDTTRIRASATAFEISAAQGVLVTVSELRSSRTRPAPGTATR